MPHCWFQENNAATLPAQHRWYCMIIFNSFIGLLVMLAFQIKTFKLRQLSNRGLELLRICFYMHTLHLLPLLSYLTHTSLGLKKPHASNSKNLVVIFLKVFLFLDHMIYRYMYIYSQRGWPMCVYLPQLILVQDTIHILLLYRTYLLTYSYVKRPQSIWEWWWVQCCVINS